MRCSQGCEDLCRDSTLIMQPPSVRVKARITDCDVLVRIDKQSPNIAGGVDVGKDDLDDGAGLRHARDETQATVQHHVDLSVVVQRRVRPQSKESSKTVEVPQVQCIDKVTDVPVVVQRQVPVIQTVEKAESNPAGSKADVTWTTEAVTLGDGPSMFETTPEQHMFAVTYADEVAKHINKIVDVPVVSQRQAPNIQTETAEVLQTQFPDGVVADRPVLGLPAMTQQRHVMIEEVVMPSRALQLMVQEVLVPFATPRRLSQKRKLRSSTSGLSTKASALAKSLQAKSSSSMLA